MSDPVDRALLERRLAKAAPHRPRLLTIRHSGSGATKTVEYLGMTGVPLRAQIHWPIAGSYLVAPRTGTIVGERKNAERLRPWRVVPEDHAFLRQEYYLARARVPQRAPRAKDLTKCP